MQFRLILLFSFFAATLNAQISFPFQNNYFYLKGSEAQDIPSTWYKSSYSPTGWANGNAPFYYDIDSMDEGTFLDDMQGNYTTVYLKTEFNVEDTTNVNNVTFSVNYDDGFIVWVNDQEVISRNDPFIRNYNSLATTGHESGAIEKIGVPISNSGIVVGTNYISVQIFNVNITSSDLYFDFAVEGKPELPLYNSEWPLRFSHEAGFYNEPFSLTVNSDDPEATIIYTLDGSNPQNSDSCKIYDNNTGILIDPASKDNKPATPAVTLRLSLVKDGFKPSIPITKTYIFTNNVVTQNYPGGKWPLYYVNDQVIDVAMDADIYNDSRYKGVMQDALLDIPSISIVTDLENLFDAASGIYVNAREHGISWERECSVELINPDGAEGFNVNAGLRIRGGNSRKGDNPKHAFRLFFRDIYGNSKLKYPLFGNDGADEFDKVDLRTAQNYSWSMDGSEHNTFLRDVFMRDLQGEMGQPYTRSRFYHLYLNGMYWGLYQTEERPEANFAESYLGGNKDDYDVIKVATENWPYVNEATDGNMNAWEELYEICRKSQLSQSDYFALESKDENGINNTQGRHLVDIDNLIDYMLAIFYTGNVDAPVSAWYGNNMPNNYFAINNRNSLGQGFVFVGHDAEHSLFVDPIYVHNGLYENRVIINDPPMSTPDLSFFNPQWLHHKLCDVKEYRMRFADHVGSMFSENQPLSEEKCVDRWNKRKEEIEFAIIAESARWGDSKTNNPRTKDDDWLPEVNKMATDFFPYRSNIVLGQLKSAGLYPDLKPADILANGVKSNNEILTTNTDNDIEFVNNNGSGTIYYTTNGEDPRVIGGELNENAAEISSNESIQIIGSAQISVRIYDNNEWSTLTRLTILNLNEDYSNLKITEIHYHPDELIEGTDTIKSKELEFIELKNTGNSAINFSNIVIDSAIYFDVPHGTILLPGEFYVLASKPLKFANRYGMNASGNYKGNLSNSGEYILITDFTGSEIISCTYDDKSPWPEAADGSGFSLTSIENNPSGDPDVFSYWKRSTQIGGSPFSDDSSIEEEGENPFARTFKISPNPTSGFISVEINSGSGDNSGTLAVINQMGVEIYKQLIYPDSPTELNLEELNIIPGIYFIVYSNSTEFLVKKLIFK